MEWRPKAGIDVAIPRSVDDLGVPEALVHDIVLRQAVAMGRTSTTKLSSKLALSPGLMTKVVEDLRDLQFIEIQGMDGRDYRLAPTAGRTAAGQRPDAALALRRARPGGSGAVQRGDPQAARQPPASTSRR